MSIVLDSLLLNVTDVQGIHARIVVVRATQLVNGGIITSMADSRLQHQAIVQTTLKIQDVMHLLVKWIKHLVKAARLFFLILSKLVS